MAIELSKVHVGHYSNMHCGRIDTRDQPLGLKGYFFFGLGINVLAVKINILVFYDLVSAFYVTCRKNNFMRIIFIENQSFDFSDTPIFFIHDKCI
ncbi:MAG: hypothetical protein AAGI07_20365, partial [Bacteroidota bacterium]